MFISLIKSNKYFSLKKNIKKVNNKIQSEVSFLNKGYLGELTLYDFLKSIFGFNVHWFNMFSTLYGLRKKTKLGMMGFVLLKMEQIALKHFQLRLYLEKIIRDNIKFKVTIQSYVGIRHMQGLPVRGQRTHTNSKTIRKLEPRKMSVKSRRQQRKANKKDKKK